MGRMTRTLVLAALFVCIGLPLVLGELSDSDWRDIKSAWNRGFKGKATDMRLEVVERMAEADDARVLPYLAHTVKISNGDIKKITDRVADLQKRIDRLPYTQNEKNRTYSSEDLASLKRYQAELKVLQEALTGFLACKRKALYGFTKKTGEKSLTWLFKKGIRNPDWEVRVGVVEALGEIKDDRAVGSIITALDDRDAHVRVTALACVMTKEAKQARAKVVSMLEDKTWEVQVAALEVIEEFEFRDRDTLDALISGIEAAEGRLAEDYERVLEKITGISYYGDGKLWKRWWESNRAKFAPVAGPKKGSDGADGEDGEAAPGSPPPAAAPPRPPKGKAHITGAFYGIETKSHNIIYILDVSGSMSGPAGRKGRGKGKKGPVTSGPGHRKRPGRPVDEGPKGDTKLAVAQYELKKSIGMLPLKAWFNVIFYSDAFVAWKEEMVRATPMNKKKAYEFVDKQSPNGSTNIFDAVEKAFKIAGPGAPKKKHDERYAKTLGGADTFFLLSDGSPNSGRIPKAGDILTEVFKLNKVRKITIHTVGVGAHNVPFMKSLAHDNGGKYVKAD